MWKITFSRLDGNSFFFRYPTQWRKGVLQGSPQNFFNFFQKTVSKPFSERLRSRGIASSRFGIFLNLYRIFVPSYQKLMPNFMLENVVILRIFP
jgi:hypothetical protein